MNTSFQLKGGIYGTPTSELEQLSLFLGLPISQTMEELDFYIHFVEHDEQRILQLQMTPHFLKKQKGMSSLRPLYCEFSGKGWSEDKEKYIHKNPLLYKALGLKKGYKKVLDVTAGWGEDSYRMALMGAEVKALERSPLVFSLLQDGIQRCEVEGLRQQLQFQCENSIEYLKFLTESDLPEVVYLDPMFPDKKGRSSKEMQVLQWLLPNQEEEEMELARLSLEKTKYRLVIKRPLKSEPLLSGVTHSYKGKSIRYDLYSKN